MKRFIILISLMIFKINYSTDGDLDPTFGTSGKVITGFTGQQFEGYALAIQPDGKILLAGASFDSSSSTSYDFAIARYNTDGTLDTNFGSSGIATVDFFSDVDQCFSIGLQSDGKIILGGTAYNNTESEYRFALARLTNSGALDTDFGTSGKVTTPTGSGYSLVIQNDDKIILVGNKFISGHGYEFAMARYNADGTTDDNFGTSGVVTTEFLSASTAKSVALQADGKIVVGGYTAVFFSSDNKFALVRYDSTGNVDTSFGSDGKVITDFGTDSDQGWSVLIQDDGRIVLGGYAYVSDSTKSDFALARYKTDGSLDPTFGTAGKVTVDFMNDNDYGYAAALQTDGRIILVGTAKNPDTTYWEFAVARFLFDGSVDKSFGSDGLVTTTFGTFDQAFAVAIQSDNKILVGGKTYTTQTDLALARYLATSISINDINEAIPPKKIPLSLMYKYRGIS